MVSSYLIHTADSDVKFSSIELVKSVSPKNYVERMILHYKGIYMINNEFTVAFGTVFVPVVKMMMISLSILGFFASVRLWKYLNIVSILFVTSIWSTTLLGLIPVSMVMSSLYDKSLPFPRNLSPEVHRVAGWLTGEGEGLLSPG